MLFMRWMAALMVFGTAMVLIVGRLPMMDSHVKEKQRAAAVSASYHPMTLSDDNLVDALASLRLNHRLARVGWDHSILTLDILLREGQDASDHLVKDITSLLRLSFGQTENVHQALIRVYRSSGDHRKELLFYGDPKREAWGRTQKAGHAWTAENAQLRELLERYRLSATPAGQRWLQLIAN